MDFVRLGEHTFNRTKDCYVDKVRNKIECSDPPVDVKVEKILIHPRYTVDAVEGQLKNDIALLRLSDFVNYTGIKT